MSRAQISLAMAIGTIIAASFTWWPRPEPPAFFLEMTARASLPGLARLYYGIGLGATVAQSIGVPLEGGNRQVDYKFPIPEGRYLNLRFDPTDRAWNTMTLSHVCIVDRTGNLIRPIAPSRLKATSQIEQLHAGESELTLTTAATSDHPSLTVELGPPLILKSHARPSFRTLIRRFVFSFVPSAALSLLLVPVLISRIKPAASKWSGKLATRAKTHPTQLLFVVAAFSVILSCYPVVFFGKSFLSPNNHSHTCLLYAEMPTVPGSSEVATDEEKGSDLGAAMWLSWPASVVESRALFKHFELPLWNRYDSCGLPLLGQGQSMFGDPLHFLVLLTNGSPLVWDLKYLLAKWAFAACLGLCVLQLTRHLPAAIIIAASAPFIGFLSYRYSHPAFFSMAYSPFVLLCWFKLIDAQKGRAVLKWLGLMVLANWTLMNSGTVKEAYVLLLCMNCCGFLTLLTARSVSDRAAKVRRALFAEALFVLIATPVWLTFLHALGNSLTNYDAPVVFQTQPGRLIGLFDDIFYWHFHGNSQRLDPSANFLVLLGVLWFCLSWPRTDRQAFPWGVGVTGFLALAFAFGLVPPSLILQIPFIGRIYHVGNIFSCVAIVCLLVLAGFGIKALWTDCQRKEFTRIWIRFVLCLAALLGSYLATTPIARSGFFWGYATLLLLSTALAPWIGRLAIESGFRRLVPILGLILIFFLLHWRHGMHLSTPFDTYVMNPHQRTDLFSKSSPTLALIRSPAEPFRSVGLRYNLFPGYGGAIAIEQIDAADALMNKYYRSLMDASGLKLPFATVHEGEIEPEDLERSRAFFDMLNVRYFLGYAGGKPEIDPSLKKIGSLDLDVYESSKVWPRAFFSDQLATYGADPDFVRLLKEGDGRPFAAVAESEQRRELENLLRHRSQFPNRQIVPATAYRLSNNRTSFKIAAPGPGVVVLTETYVEDDLRLRLNGQPSNYFRVNSAFRGVFLPQAGEYQISFSYWPRHLTISLWISGFGIVLLLWWLGNALKDSKKEV